MLEVVTVYFAGLILYPVALGFYALEMEIYWELAAWGALGAAVVFLLRFFSKKVLALFFAAVWFMPGTVICGSATVLPWPATVYMLFNDGGCSSYFSVLFTLACNLLVFFFASKLINHVRHKRVRANA